MDFGKQVGRQNGPKIHHGTFHNAPERESLFFSMVLEIFLGGVPRRGHLRAGIVRPPKSRFFKTDQAPQGQAQAQTKWAWVRQAQGPWLRCLVFNFYSRRRAKRGGGLRYKVFRQDIGRKGR